MLPLARATKDEGIKFNTQSLVRAKEVASTPSAVNYLVHEVESQVAKYKDKDKHQGVLANVSEHQVKVTRLGTRASAMTYADESQVPNDHDNFQYRTALDSIQTIAELTKPDTPIKMGYAVNDDSNVKRYYAQGEQKLGDAASKASDELLNAFLSKHELITKDGVIYDYDSKEKDIAKDNKGNSIRADKDRIIKIISNPENSPNYDPDFTSFKDYASEISNDKIEFETKVYAYPVQKPAAEVKVPEAVVPVAPVVTAPEPVETPAAEVEVEPESSTPGSDRSM